MKITDAKAQHVPQMSAFLQRLVKMGKRTNRADTAFVLAHYVNSPDNIKCALAEDGGDVLGFQVLQLAMAENIYGVTPGWGIIGTHVNPDAARRGVGRALFEVTLQAAKAQGLRNIDASIVGANAEGLGYYDAIGFQTYREHEGRICKRYDLTD